MSHTEQSNAVSILDKEGMRRALTRIAHEILEHNGGTSRLILLGVRTRGVPIAHRIAALIKQFERADVAVAEMDITPYRDDRSEGNNPRSASVGGHALGRSDVEGANIVLVDDVFYTGRTVRAAIDAIMDAGRPGSIQLAVLVDRGHRELPIRADYVGKNVPTARHEHISVRLEETDGSDEVVLVRSAP